jgi:hypothetical protein
MKKLVMLAAAAAGLVAVGCSSPAGSSSSASSTQVSAAAASQPKPSAKSSTQSSSVAIEPWSGSATFTDSPGYEYRLNWTFSASAATDDSQDTVNDSPGQATIELPTTATISLTNLSGRNAPVGDDAEIDIIGIYQASSPFCNVGIPFDTPPTTVGLNGKSFNACPAILASGTIDPGNTTVPPGATTDFQDAWFTGAITGSTEPDDLYVINQSQEQAMIATINTTKPKLLVIGVGSGEGTFAKCVLPVSLNGQTGSQVVAANSGGINDITCQSA